MQQTEKYELNLIETGDPLSPVPLNENAVILDGLVAGITAEQHLFKLGETEITGDPGPLSIDLSGVDVSQYCAILLLSQLASYTGSQQLYVNGVKCGTVANAVQGSTSSVTTSAIITLLAPAGDNVLMFSRYFGFNANKTSTTGDLNYGRADVPWEDVHTLSFSANYKVGSRMKVLGVKF